jgi:hypothetical protein
MIACIGRAARGPERDLYEHYANRIRWPLVLRELEEKKKLPAAQLMLREGELLLDAAPAGAVLVALVATRAVGYIHFPPMTLPKMCQESHHIRALKVEKFDKQKGVVVFGGETWLYVVQHISPMTQLYPCLLVSGRAPGGRPVPVL